MFRMSPSNLPIGQRLAFGFTALIALMLVVAGINADQMARQQARMATVIDVHDARAAQAYALRDDIGELAVLVRSIALMNGIDQIDAEMARLEQAQARYRDTEKALRAAIATAGTPGEAQLAQRIAEAAARSLPLAREAAQQGADGMNVEATLTLNKRLRPEEVTWRTAVSELIALEARLAREAYAEAQAAQAGAQRLIGGLVLAAVVVGVTVAVRITRSVKKPIALAIAVAERIAHGDLATAVPPGHRNEIGRLLQAVASMQDRLRDLVGEIRSCALGIRGASAEVASGNLDLSQRTELAAANLQRTTGSMGVLTESVSGAAEAATEADRLAAEAAASATRGGGVVSTVMATMNEIGGSSRRIGDIVGVIDAIAFQTNILALNAAVESARAGQYGRGFAVVAGEVRSLAARASVSAREIRALVASTAQQIDDGCRQVHDAGAAMVEIEAAVRRVHESIHRIQQGAVDQRDGLREIHAAVEQLDGMTQQNAALVEQSAAAAASLNDQAVTLDAAVSAFRLGASDPIGRSEQDALDQAAIDDARTSVPA